MRGRINRPTNKTTRSADFIQRMRQKPKLTRVQKDYQMACINAGRSVNTATLLGIGSL